MFNFLTNVFLNHRMEKLENQRFRLLIGPISPVVGYIEPFPVYMRPGLWTVPDV